jgi:hypothetical protein
MRASAFRGLALQGGVKLLRGAWNADFLREVSTFPRTGSGLFDDCIDAAGLLAKRMARISSGTAPKGPETPVKVGYSLDDLFKDKESWRRDIVRL